MIFHKYPARNDCGDRIERSGVHVFPFWCVCFLLTVTVFIAGQARGEADRLLGYNVAFQKTETTWSEALAKEKKNVAELQVKYEGLQCSTRNLVITTVKGITLCMNPETKALHKIDSNAD